MGGSENSRYNTIVTNSGGSETSMTELLNSTSLGLLWPLPIGGPTASWIGRTLRLPLGFDFKITIYFLLNN